MRKLKARFIDPTEGENLRLKFQGISHEQLWEYINGYCSEKNVLSFTISDIMNHIKEKLAPEVTLFDIKTLCDNKKKRQNYTKYSKVTKTLSNKLEGFFKNTLKNNFINYNLATDLFSISQSFKNKQAVLSQFRKSSKKLLTATNPLEKTKQEEKIMEEQPSEEQTAENQARYVSFVTDHTMQTEENHQLEYFKRYEKMMNACKEFQYYSKNLPEEERKKLEEQFPISNIVSMFPQHSAMETIVIESPNPIPTETILEPITTDPTPKKTLKRKRKNEDQDESEKEVVDALLYLQQQNIDADAEIEPKTKIAKHESTKTAFELIQLDKRPTIMQDLSKAGEGNIRYHCDNEEDIKKLEKDANNKIEYDRKTNVQNADKIFLAPVSILHNQLGAYAKSDIKNEGKPFAVYAGKKISAGSFENAGAYCFQICDAQGNIISYIDAEVVRDFSGYFNHSDTPTLYAQQENINGEATIVLYLARDIKAGEQLTFNYKREYFDALEIQPFYIHSKDNWMSDAEKYNQGDTHKFYVNKKYTFDNQTRQELELADNEWLIPTLFIFVKNNNPTSLKTSFTWENTDPDLAAYACQRKVMCEASEQQHLTALMLACYLGHEDCIQVLIDAKADVNRCMLVSGNTPLSLLLMGRSDDKQMIEKISLQLLETMAYPFVINRNELTILHYAILRGIPSIVDKILQISKYHDVALLATMYDRNKNLPPHADFNYCVAKGEFRILKSLLTWALNEKNKPQFIELLESGEIFSEDFLKTISLDNLNKLKNLLKQTPFIACMKKQGVLESLNKVLKDKSNTQKPISIFSQPKEKSLVQSNNSRFTKSR